MSFITQTEKMWLEQGALQNEKKILEKLLHQKFHQIPDRYLRKIEETNEPGTLDHWVDNVLKAKSIDEIFVK